MQSHKWRHLFLSQVISSVYKLTYLSADSRAKLVKYLLGKLECLLVTALLKTLGLKLLKSAQHHSSSSCRFVLLLLKIVLYDSQLSTPVSPQCIPVELADVCRTTTAVIIIMTVVITVTRKAACFGPATQTQSLPATMAAALLGSMCAMASITVSTMEPRMNEIVVCM